MVENNPQTGLAKNAPMIIGGMALLGTLGGGAMFGLAGLIGGGLLLAAAGATLLAVASGDAGGYVTQFMTWFGQKFGPLKEGQSSSFVENAGAEFTLENAAVGTAVVGGGLGVLAAGKAVVNKTTTAVSNAATRATAALWEKVKKPFGRKAAPAVVGEVEDVDKAAAGADASRPANAAELAPSRVAGQFEIVTDASGRVIEIDPVTREKIFPAKLVEEGVVAEKVPAQPATQVEQAEVERPAAVTTQELSAKPPGAPINRLALEQTPQQNSWLDQIVSAKGSDGAKLPAPAHLTTEQMIAVSDAEAARMVDTLQAKAPVAPFDMESAARASGMAAGGALLSGAMRLSHSQNTTDTLLGGADVVDGVVESAAFVSRNQRLLSIMPYVTGPVAALNVPFDVVNAVQAAKDGNYVEAGRSSAMGGSKAALSANAVGRMGMAQKLFESAGRIGKPLKFATGGAGRLFAPLGAVLGVIDIACFGQASNQLVQETHAAIEQDAALHEGGVTRGYAPKIQAMAMNQLTSDAPVPMPELQDYRQLPRAMRIIHRQLSDGAAVDEPGSIANINAFEQAMAQAERVLMQKKQAALANVPDHFLSRTDSFQTDRELAKTPEGRLRIEQMNNARGQYPLISGLVHDDSKQQALNAIENIDSQLRTLSQARYELRGDPATGLLHGNEMFLSYASRAQRASQTQAHRQQLADHLPSAEALRQDLAAAREAVSKLQGAAGTQVQAVLGIHKDVQEAQQKADAYGEFAKLYPADDVIQRVHLAAQLVAVNEAEKSLRKDIGLQAAAPAAATPAAPSGERFVVNDVDTSASLPAPVTMPAASKGPETKASLPGAS